MSGIFVPILARKNAEFSTCCDDLVDIEDVLLRSTGSKDAVRIV